MDPVPPVTGPTTRAQLMRARVRLLNIPVKYIIAAFAGIAFAAGMACAIKYPPPQRSWLIECPDREPWISEDILVSGERLMAWDAHGRRVYLVADCQATEITHEAE